MKVFQYPSPFFIPVPQNPIFLLSDVDSLLFLKTIKLDNEIVTTFVLS